MRNILRIIQNLILLASKTMLKLILSINKDSVWTTKHKNKLNTNNCESEREAVVFCKRGEKKEKLIREQNSVKINKSKKSLIEAREPPSEIISQASFWELKNS